MTQTLSLQAFRERFDPSDSILLDVRLESDFENGHIPDAVNNCVFEVQFPHRMNEIAPDLDQPILVYGFDKTSHEARVAAEKLERLGYTNVFVDEAGFEGWRQANNASDAPTTIEFANSVDPINGEFPVDVGQSSIEWIGRNLASRHHGSLRISGGYFHFENGLPTRGRAELDMNSIEAADIQSPQMRKVLDDHLKSHDFFDSERFPVGVVELAQIRVSDSAASSLPNMQVEGSLTLKDVKNPISIAATHSLTAEGRWIAQAHFDIDRTEWDVIYGSSRYFRSLGQHLVHDLISLQIKIVV